MEHSIAPVIELIVDIFHSPNLLLAYKLAVLLLPTDYTPLDTYTLLALSHGNPGVALHIEVAQRFLFATAATYLRLRCVM